MRSLPHTLAPASAAERCLPEDTGPHAPSAPRVRYSVCADLVPGPVLGAGRSVANQTEAEAVLQRLTAYGQRNAMNRTAHWLRR